MNNIVFVKIGKAVDWVEIDVSQPENVNYMFDVVEPFLDFVVDTPENKKLASTKLECVDDAGTKYTPTVRELIGGAMKVYYGDSDQQPNLTPLLPDRTAGLATDLLDQIAEFVFEHTPTNKQVA